MGWATLALGLVGFALVAALVVPWQPVPGGMPDPAAPSTVFSAAEIARAESYSRVIRWLGWTSLGLSLAVAVILGFGPWGRRLIGRIPGRWWVQVTVGTIVLLGAGRLATLPITVVAWRWRTRWELTTQGLPGLLRDVVVGFAVSALVSCLVVLVVVGTARRLPRVWPAVAGGVLASAMLVISFGYPIVVEPLFNTFTPLAAGQLRTEVLALAADEGVPVREVLVADASRRTTTLNAYVSGFGATRRVVLYDNLVHGVPQDQALAVVAHELAHARHRDVWWGSLLGAFGTLAGIGALGAVRWGRDVRWRDQRAVPRLLALVAVATLVGTPIQSAISRRIETRADVDALASSASPEAMVALQHQLAVRSLGDPTPPRLAYLIFGTHPLTLERVALARREASSRSRR